MNEGQDFVSHVMDAFHTEGSVRLVKGPLDGEFYLVAKSSVTGTFSIFRTLDYGENFSLQYTMEIPHYSHFLAFAAGKEMCDFYIVNYQPLWMYSPENTQLTIMHSSDCAQTFSTYHHQFISNYEGNPISITHTVTPEAFPPKAGLVAGGGVFDHGQNVTLTAEPLQGYSFTHWSENGEVVSVEAEFVFAVKDSRRIAALFEATQQIDNPENEKYFLHPNPSREQVIFTVLGFDLADKLHLEIFNLQGQQLDRVLITQIETQINVSNLEPGMFFYRILRNGSVESFGKMMVVR